VTDETSTTQSGCGPADRSWSAGRRGLLGLLACCVFLIAPASSAWASVGFSVTPNIPANGAAVSVGQTGVQSNITLTNASNGAQANDSLTVSSGSIQLVASCGTAPPNGACPSSDFDPGVFQLSSTASGQSACAGTTFTIVNTNAAEGLYQFNPSSTVTLGPSATCTISFTVSVLKTPTKNTTSPPFFATDDGATAAAADNSASPVITAMAYGTSETIISLATPAISTAVSPASIGLGGTFSDTATISGSGPAPTGTVDFTVYGPNDTTCSSSPAFVSTGDALTTSGGVTTATSASFRPTAAGSYHVIASYGGDSNYASASGACGAAGETEVVAPAVVGMATAVSPTPITLGQAFTDHATMTATAGAPTPTGTVSFSVYGPGNQACTGTPAFTSTGDALSTSGGVTGATSAAFTPAAAGSYNVVASYSGDANYTPLTSACGAANETEVVSAATAALSSAVSPGVSALGGSFHDTATVSGSGPAPTGTVTFTVFGPGNPTCAGSPAFTATGDALSTSGGVTSATSPSFTPAAAGTYLVVARYSGDANYAAVTSACGAANETATITPATPGLATAVAPTPITLGGAFHDTATVSGSGPAPTGTVSFDFYGPSDSSCSKTPAFTSTGNALATSGGVTSVTSPSFTPTASGTYMAVAHYSGDANYSAVTGACGAAGETETVSAAVGPTQITGTVKNAAGTALSNICVYLYAAGASGARTSDAGTCTTATGSYVLNVAAAGSYNVAFFDPTGTYITQWATGKSSEATANPVVVTSGAQTTGVNATLTGVTQITGKVTNGAGTPVANVCVYLYAAGATGARTSDPGACTTAAGTYTMGVSAAGSYNVAFFDPSGTYVTQWATGKASEATANPVVVTAGATTAAVNATLTGVTRITGTVTSMSGTALPNICVYLYASGATGARTADPGVCTNASGSYSLPVAAGGSYNVAFYDPSGTYVTQWANGKSSEASANAVTVTSGAQTAGVNATMVP
jgi:hypothetical protein